MSRWRSFGVYDSTRSLRNIVVVSATLLAASCGGDKAAQQPPAPPAAVKDCSVGGVFQSTPADDSDVGRVHDCFVPAFASPTDAEIERMVSIGKTRTARYDATNAAKGPCARATFSIVDISPAPLNHSYRDGETLTAVIRYDAPGCSEMRVTFGGRHVAGSPWFNHYCKACRARTFGSNIPSDVVPLRSSQGDVTVAARPGVFPPEDFSSVPNLEGFELCALVVGVGDGKIDGSSRSDQLDIACFDQIRPPETPGVDPSTVDSASSYAAAPGFDARFA